MKGDNVSGFSFGKLSGKNITKKEDMDGHILVVGGAGSGKSSCLAIPSLYWIREAANQGHIMAADFLKLMGED